MFGTIKGLIPEPRQADQPRSYVGRHRHGEATVRRARAGASAEPAEPTRRLASAAAMTADPDAGADARP